MFIIDAVGLSIPIFALVWALIGLYLLVRNKDLRIAGLLAIVGAVVGAGIYIFLTISTPTRRAYINLDMRGLASGLIRDVIGIIIGLLLAAIIYWIARRLAPKSGVLFGVVVLVGMALVFAPAMLALYNLTFSPDLDEATQQVTSVEGVLVEDGIPVKIFENTNIKVPTAMELGPDNELYVASNEGSIWRMVDSDEDGVADEVTAFATGLSQPQGLAWGEDGLFVNVNGQLLFLQDTDGDNQADVNEVILDTFPGEIYAFHRNHGLTFGADGRLYIGSGATSDASPEVNDMAARIFSINPDGTDLQVYATGVRNPYGIIPAPDGGFFAIENGPAGCAGPECTENFDVPEEVNYILEGKDYGFPNYFGMPPADSDTMPPLITFPDHSAPTGIEIYTGDLFPKFKDQLFVSLWASGEIYRIRLYKIDDEHYTGAAKRFAGGFLGPSALLNSPQGGLYVASYTGNAIYHVG